MQWLLVDSGCRVMELIHDDEVIVILRQVLIKLRRVQGLNRYEKMIERFRLMTADPQVSEIEVVQDAAEGFDALLEDLFPMRHEEEPVLLARMRLTEARIIEGGDHGFSTAGRGHDQIPGMPEDLPLDLELIEDFLLIGIWTDIEDKLPLCALADVLFISKRLDQTIPLGCVIQHELTVIPVAREGGPDLLNRIRHVLFRRLHIPLEATREGRVRHI
mgnify:CR=1 FL=1